MSAPIQQVADFRSNFNPFLSRWVIVSAAVSALPTCLQLADADVVRLAQVANPGALPLVSVPNASPKRIEMLLRYLWHKREMIVNDEERKRADGAWQVRRSKNGTMFVLRNAVKDEE
ncbi:hypothetical protein FACS1894189_2530 [Planctomycetales bacterium]|nr:hypothetical protein FACS1894189_2530 [Planctomycetales bacterium]